MRKPFKGCSIPSSAELDRAVYEARQRGESDIKLCKMVKALASNLFETDLRKNLDYFVMEAHATPIVNAMTVQALHDVESCKLAGAAYQFIQTSMKGSFIRYVHHNLRNTNE